MSGIIAHQDRGDATRKLMSENPPSPKTSHRRPEPYPGATKVIESRPRPFSELSGGIRHIPKLQATSGLPFLLFKKPQSPFLSRIIKATERKKTGWNALAYDYSDLKLETMYEDQWDEITGEKPKVKTNQGRRMDWDVKEGNGVEDRWSTVPRMWYKDTRNKLLNLQNKNMELGRKMQDIVDQETLLAGREKEERRAEKRRR
jgi:hypothetical protein